MTNMDHSFFSRREFVSSATFGVSNLAIASLMHAERGNAAPIKPDFKKPTFDVLPKAPLSPPKATAMISLFMQGGPSHMDLFDPKQIGRAHV